MWNIPPIIGQKVMLNPSYAHYQDFNRTQAKNRDGYILSVQGMDLPRWLVNQRIPTLTILWESGHENVYELDALLPIDSFKTIERVEFKGGSFLNVCSEKAHDYIAERVIMKNDDVKHYSFFDKEKRLDVLRKAELAYTKLNESDQNNETVQMKYMHILKEMERTKRAEEVVLFLESEGIDDVSTPKKHLSQDQVTTAPLEHSRIYQASTRTAPFNEVRNPFQLGESVANISNEDAQSAQRTIRDWESMMPMLNPLSDHTLIAQSAYRDAVANLSDYLVDTTRSTTTTRNKPHQLGEVAMSPYMEEMGRYGQRLREQELQRMLDEPRQPLVENHLTRAREQAIEMGDFSAVASIDRLIRASQD